MRGKRIVIPVVLTVLSLAFLVVYLNDDITDYPEYYKQMRFLPGDSLAWSQPSYDDKNWEKDVPVTTSTNWWLRVPLKFKRAYDNGKTIGLWASIQGSYQIFWDGYLVGENGRWGNSKVTEREGSRNNYFIIPDSLLHDSNHLVAVRLSSYYDPGRKIYPAFVIGNYMELVRGELKFAIFLHILAGVFLVIAVCYFFLFFISYKHLTYLLFGLLCFSFFSMIMLEYLRAYYLYPYSFHFKRLFAIASLAFFIGNILLVFLLTIFRFRYKGMVLAALNIFLVLAWITRTAFDDKTKTLSIIAFTFALLVCLLAVIRQRRNSQEIFYGVFGCLSCHINYDFMVYMGFFFFVLVMLIVLSRQLKEQLRSHQEELVRSKRLEIELLKKNIQPHFLMNSLTSLMEWVERSPKSSIDFIGALASEFSILNEISGEKLVPIMQEIGLCEAHLKIMSFRKDILYRLQISGIAEAEKIPPAVLLTLIENGITHNVIREETAVCSLDFSRQGNTKIYTLFVPGEVKIKDKEMRRGTGITYIETRLQESYAGKWKMTGRSARDGWETVIMLNQ